MKKLFSLLIVLVLVFSIMSCESTEKKYKIDLEGIEFYTYFNIYETEGEHTFIVRNKDVEGHTKEIVHELFPDGTDFDIEEWTAIYWTFSNEIQYDPNGKETRVLKLTAKKPTQSFETVEAYRDKIENAPKTIKAIFAMQELWGDRNYLYFTYDFQKGIWVRE